VIINFPKALIVLLVCMAFVGQAMASTIMSYHMMSMKVMDEQSQDMPMMDHSNHNMVSDSSENTHKSMKDCCDTTCNCFVGGCTIIAVFMKNIVGNIPIVDVSSRIFFDSSLALTYQPTSLYRPPILS
jgi:hypothetical protein